MAERVGADDAAIASADTLEQTRPIDPPAHPRAGVTPGPGTRIGRFSVLEALGAGGMAFVLAAYDPGLDRRVALKLLRADRGAASASGRDRLLREARAMARLSHPNVIVVHEVGVFDEQVFVAMEFADAGTLRTWCRAARRPAGEVLAKFRAAGRGLLAAHEAGMVHRDFKPANVLLTRGGAEVKVADFGLVGAGAVEVPSGDAAGEISESVFGQTLTVAGALIGTPSYMAPEQHLRARVGPAADQFAFCVALWEALYGEPPFRGGGYADLKRRATSGEIAPPPASAEVPGWIRPVLERGLRAVPEERWPSMRELLAALEADPAEARQRTRRVALAAAGGAALAAVAAVALWPRPAAERPDPCAGAEARVAPVWGDARRQAVRAAFVAKDAPTYAADTATRVVAGLDRYAAAWVSAHRDACEATHVRGEQSPATLDLRMRCLDRRLRELDALADIFASPGPTSVLDRAADATAKLSPIEACADADALAQAVPLPADPARRERIEEARARLDRIKAREQAGQYAEAVAAAEPVVEQAAGLGYVPLEAEARYRLGRLNMGTGNAAQAEALLWQALSDASAAHDDALAVRALADLLYVISFMENRVESAALLRPVAEAAARRLDPDDEALVGLWNSVGLVAFQQGKHAEARELIGRAVALREKQVGPVHADVASGLNNLGTVLEAEGRYEEALETMRRALEMKERTLGPMHPAVAHALNNLGVALLKLGRPGEARGRLERALAVWEAALGPRHANVATAHHNLGTALEAEGDPAAARDHLEQALALRLALLGPEHPNVALTLTALARVDLALGEVARARERAEQALQVRREHPGDPTLLAETELALAQTLWTDRRQRPRARRLAEEARAIYGAAGPKGQRALGDADAWLAAHPAP